MPIDTSIFKAYDIRGVYPTQLNEELAKKIGLSYAKLLRQENPDKDLTVVVARDMRISSPQLRDAVVAGLTQGGLNVVDIGLASTPTFYFAVGFYGYDGGIQVSASHNPKEYNGFKMVRANAAPISGDNGIYQIRDWIVEDALETTDQKGTVTTKDGILEDLVPTQIKDWQIDISQIRPLKIVVDAANAMGAVDVSAMMAGLPVELIKMNFELDGTFPAHQADPLDDENMAQLKQAVLQHQADLGIAPDGDGDRYFFVDEKGNSIRQEILRGIMSQIVLERYPNEIICYDIRPGKITEDMILEAGGKPSVTKVGHSLIKEQMLAEGAPYGGESSGHYFYRFEYGSFEAPVVMVLLLLHYFSQANKPLSEIIAPLQKYHHSGEINSVVDNAQTVLERIKHTYSDADISTLDGVTVTYKEWWFNVRASNTEPKVRLNLEAVTEELMTQKRDEVLELIRQ